MNIRTSHLILASLSIFIASLFSNCIFIRSCHDDIEGKYSLLKKGDFINYLILKEDGSYYHYYNKNGIELSSIGKWEKVDDPYCKIKVTDWENYNEKGLNFDKRGSIFYINEDFLDTTPDGEDNDSFEKTDNLDQ